MRPRPTLPTWWRFTLHLNPPAWSGGARARLVDEDLPLRTASVRGALRHWLRLALGEVLGGGDGDRALALGTLRELETVMFGAVGRGAPEGARVLLKPPVGGRVKKVTRQDEPKLGTGRRYMSYGVFDGNKRPEVVTGLTADDAHPVHLVVGLHVRSGDSGPQREALRRALGAVLWLGGSFGGLGGRSRRGWGGVELLPWARSRRSGQKSGRALLHRAPGLPGRLAQRALPRARPGDGQHSHLREGVWRQAPDAPGVLA
ncbi:MAG: hypothetical protein IPN01_20685 [Deltaproteobacteria bacterium]|nr:hypothetical protein [Deltaproteobacteria bacterium]